MEQAVVSSSATEDKPTVPPQWHVLLRDGWQNSLLLPGVCVDADGLQCFVHGGRTTGQRGLISSSLFRLDLSAFAASPPRSTGIGISGIESSNEAARAMTAVAPRLQLLYADGVFSVRASSLPTARAHKPSVLARGPACFDHVLLRHGSVLVTHGGCPRPRQVSDDVFAYHLTSGVWEDIRGELGGCAPPRMHGHAAACLSEDEGRYLVVGVECGPGGTRFHTHKRPRTVKGGPRGLSVFVLNLQDMTEGWQRLSADAASTDGPTAGSAAGHGPGPRIRFSLDVFPKRRPYRGEVAEADLTSSGAEAFDGGGSSYHDNVVAATHAYVVGGTVGGEEQRDVWQLGIDSLLWREVHVAIHPRSALSVSGTDALRKGKILSRMPRLVVYELLAHAIRLQPVNAPPEALRIASVEPGQANDGPFITSEMWSAAYQQRPWHLMLLTCPVDRIPALVNKTGWRTVTSDGNWQPAHHLPLYTKERTTLALCYVAAPGAPHDWLVRLFANGHCACYPVPSVETKGRQN